MVTTKMLDYLAVMRKSELISALKRNDHNGDYNGISKSIALISVLRVVVDNELNFEELKEMF